MMTIFSCAYCLSVCLLWLSDYFAHLNFFIIIVELYGLFIIYFVICKKRAVVELMLMVIIMAVSCTVDHHLLDIAYNFVPLALFAAVESKAAGKRVLIEKITC